MIYEICIWLYFQGALMIESLDGVMPKFLQGIMAPVKPKPVETIKDDDDDEEDENKPDGKMRKISTEYQSIFSRVFNGYPSIDTIHSWLFWNESEAWMARHNCGTRVAWACIGDVANSKHPLLIIGKVQLCLRAPAHSCSFLPAQVGNSFFK